MLSGPVNAATAVSVSRTVTVVTPILSPHPGYRLLSVRQCILQLQVVCAAQDLSHSRAGPEAEREQVASAQERLRLYLFDSHLATFRYDEFVFIEHAVTCQTVDPVQLEFIVHGRPCKKTLERRQTHLLDMHEPHMVTDRCGDVLDEYTRSAKPFQYRDCHLRPDDIVIVETDAVGFGFGSGLADVVQQNAPCEVL